MFMGSHVLVCTGSVKARAVLQCALVRSRILIILPSEAVTRSEKCPNCIIRTGGREILGRQNAAIQCLMGLTLTHFHVFHGPPPVRP